MGKKLQRLMIAIFLYQRLLYVILLCYVKLYLFLAAILKACDPVLPVNRCEECKSASSTKVIREFDSMCLDQLLEDLALLRIDHESLTGTSKHRLPPCQDFMQWDATQLFTENIIPEGLIVDEDRSHLEPTTSWREAKNRLDQILTAPTDPHSSSEQFREARKQLDAVWRIVSDLEDQLEESRLRNTALTETLSETRQLLETEHQKQVSQGLRHH